MINEYTELGNSLGEIIKSCSIDNELFSVDYEYSKTAPTPDSAKTVSAYINVLVTITNRYTQETVKTSTAVLEVPVKTSLGYKIEGTYYSMMGIDKRASGWYIAQKNENGHKVIIEELIPDSGLRLKLFELYKELCITIGANKRNKDKINVGVFLKALTGKSYKELALLLGIHNKYIQSTLVNEPTRDQCIDKTLGGIMKKSGYLMGDYKFKELKRRLYSKQFLNYGNARERTLRWMSFTERCLGKELGKDVLSYKKGIVLTREILEEIDNSNIDTLFIRYNSKLYELKKYKLKEQPLCVEELLTAVNMLAVALDGYPSKDEVYELHNRRNTDFKDSVEELVRSNLSQINDIVSRAFLDTGKDTDISTIRIPYFDLQVLINRIRIGSKEAQSAETCNALSVLAKDYKEIIDYNGNGNEEMIRVKDSEIGIYDAFHQPESQKVGMVHYRTMNCIKDKDGIFKGQYIAVKNGEPIKGDIVLLDPYKTTNSYIAPWDADLTQDKVICYYQGRVIKVDKKLVQYQELGPLNNMSLPTALIPFGQHDAGKRIVMGGGQAKQAVPTLKTERPLVSTGVCGYYDLGVVRAKTILEKYFLDNSLNVTMDYDEFINLPIQIITSDVSIPGTRQMLFDILMPNGERRNLKYIIPFCARTTEGTMTQYNINFKDDYIYQGDDIVFYDNSYDIKKYDLDYFVDFGNMPEKDKSVFDIDMALGNNYFVAYKSHSSVTIDDAFVISSAILGTGKTMHMSIRQCKTKLEEFEEGKEIFETPPAVRGFNSNGLPKIGSYLKPQSIAIYKKLQTDRGPIWNTERLDDVTEGEVIHSFIEGNEAIVWVASYNETEIGDKYAGSHGNKNVIAKIVPECDMPYTEDGKRVDICLDPQGIPSRMNIGQLLEHAMGYALKKKGDNKAVVMTPQYKMSFDVVMQYMKETGVDKEYLYDGRTGRKFDRPISVGYLNLKKLKHFAISKSVATGINLKVNPVTMQTRKGKKVSGGQTMGEMEMWAYMSAGLDNCIQEMMSIQSDDIKGKWALINYAQDGCEASLKVKSNNNDSALLTPCRLMGVDIINDPKTGRYKPKIMTDADICALAPRAIENHKDYLQDSTIFGVTREPSLLAKTRQRWGYMNLNCEIINPLWIFKSRVANLLIVTEVSTSDSGERKFKRRNLNSMTLRNIIGGKIATKNGSDDFYVSIQGEKVYFTTEKNIDSFEWRRGIAAVVDVFKTCKLVEALNYYEGLVNTLEESIADKTEDVFKTKQTIDFIKSLMEQDLDLKDFVIRHLPIIPRNFRMENMGRSSDFDMHYVGIMASAEASKNVDRSDDVFRKVAEFIGFIDSDTNKDKQVMNILNYFTGKNMDNSDGYFRDKGLSKVIDLSMRAVIVPAEAGLIKVTEIGIPFNLGTKALAEFIKPQIIKAYPILKPHADRDKNYMDELLIAICNKDIMAIKEMMEFDHKANAVDALRTMRNIIIDVIESRPINAGRQPTLHRYGIRCFMPKVVDGLAIRLHQLVCSAYNADFDGDQMHAEFPATETAAQEALRGMSPSSDLINPKNGSFVLEPNQNTILGTYLATMLYENKLDISDKSVYSTECIAYYNNIDLMKWDILNGILRYQDLVCYKHENGNRYLSTAGRIVFNSIIPGALTDKPFTNTLNIPTVNEDIYGINPKLYKELMFDGLIKKKPSKNKSFRVFGMSEITSYLFENFTGVTVCEVMDEIFKFGTTACDYSGISIGLKDFVEHPQRDDLVKRADRITEDINTYYSLGLMSEEDRKTASDKIYKYLTSSLKNTLMNYYDRNNDLFIMLDSGARGNVSQLMQSVGVVGIVSKTSKESLETPVLGNYVKGLSSAEQMLIAYGTRIGVSTVQNNTASAGELTRGAVYNLAGLKIVEHDCGNTEDCDFKVHYSDSILEITLNGEEVSPEQLFGLHIENTDENHSKFIALSGELINSTALYFIKKNRIRKIITKEGIVLIKYKLSKMFRNLMKHRLAYDLPYLKFDKSSLFTDNELNYGIMTSKTLDYIEQENLTNIKVRTMLTCKSVNGVCAKCFGINPSAKKYPKIGSRVGCEAAQAFGEPSVQLNMDSINKGNHDDKSSGSAVNTFKAYSNGSTPGKGEKAIVANNNGLIRVKSLGKDYFLLQDGESFYKVRKDALLVKDKEYVNRGDVVANGFLDVNDIHLADSREELFRRQISLLDIFHNIFSENSIDIDVRNFECLVRVQLSLGRVLHSENPNFVEGRIYPLQELVNANPEDGYIDFYSRVEPSSVTINKYSGALTNLSHRSFAENLASFATIPDKQITKSTSIISQMLIGEDVVTGKPKKLKTLRYKNTDNFEKEIEETDTVFSDLVLVKQDENIFENAELSNISIFDDLLGDMEEAAIGENDKLDFGEEIDKSNVFKTEESKPEKGDTSEYITSEMDESKTF